MHSGHTTKGAPHGDHHDDPSAVASQSRLAHPGQHKYDEWHAALLPLGASSAMECEERFGLYVEHQVNSDGTYEVRLHVPKLA